MKNHYLKLFCSFYFLVILSAGAAFAQVTHQVTVQNFEFSPAELIINAGDIVQWTNLEGFHNVGGSTGTFPNNPESFGNDPAGAGWTYSYTFNVAGTYNYQCDIHPSLMQASISVIATLDCPLLEANIGDPCDDANADTENDMVTESCDCAGTPIFAGDFCGSEDFSSSDLTSSYSDGSFIGNGGVTWTYTASRDENGDANGSGIDGKAIMLRRVDDNSKVVSSAVSGGIADFSVKLYKGFTGGGDRQVELFVNGVSKGVSVPFDDFDEHIFEVNGIDISGDVTIEIRNITPKQVIVDNITWTCAGFDCPILEANIGDACDDGNAETVDDMISENCECVGTPISEFDCPTLEANIGDACDDGNSDTENDMVSENCECAGTLIVFDCPILEANFGDTCDDGDSNTENDLITENCDCAGTPILTGDFCGSEDFSSSDLTSSYSDGSFIGNGGVTWTYTASRDENGDANGSGIDGKAIMLRRVDDNSKVVSSAVSGGIADFSVKLYKGFTGGGDRQVELFVNGVSKGVSVPFDDFDEHIFEVNGIDISGDVTIEIRNITPKQVIVDNITWTCADYDCPILEANIGDACDDGNPETTDDIVTENCNCAGTPLEIYCVNTVSFPAGQINLNTQDLVFISGCIWFGDVSTITGINSGYEYEFAGQVEGSGDLAFITVRADSTDGPIIGAGFSPLTVTALSDANLFVHWNNGTDCSSGNDCIPATGMCLTCAGFDCPTLEANIGDACDDGNSDTENDMVSENCECAGTLIVFDCPILEANFGDTCDDGDSNTENDMVTENCDCAGTPIFTGDFCGSEDFSSSDLTSSYSDGSFIGNGGVTWTYTASRDENGDANGSGIDGKAIMLRRVDDNSKVVSSAVSGGIADFSVKLYKGFTGAGDRQVELFVNGVSKGVSVPFDDFDEHIFEVNGIDISGDVTIEIRNITPKQVIVDNITWTCAGFDCAILEANIGDACDDGNAETVDDMISENCECVGTPISEFDCPTLEANIGDACDDGNSDTENDMVSENCECAGTLIVFDCPILEANFGDTCDDGDSNTENDLITENCDCAGTPILTGDFCGSEDFSSSDLTSSYSDGSFIGNGGVTWTYTASRDENGDANGSGIDGKAIMLRRVDDNSKVVSSAVSGGIADFSVKLYKGFTGGGDRQVELFVNGVSKGVSVPFDDFDEHIFEVNGIDICGDVTIEIRNITPKQVIVDNITWTCAGFDCPILEANIGDACDDGDANTENDMVNADCDCIGTPSATSLSRFCVLSG